ncbi:hypothetical protein MMC08_002372 [Hypocenomyce scalaris]|nr:hypothetical protein [Hypocenomyce scalaris]
MQNSPADNLPSLSSSSPLNGATQTQSDTHSWPTPAPRRNRFSTSSEPATLQRRDAAARAAKALIRENVREDWTWPSPPPAPRPAEDSNLQWRERDANSSSPSPEREPDPSDPYKYENPDSLASVIQSRKRKRRRRLLDEMRWNAGLQTYVARRDAWTGGITRSSPPPSGGHTNRAINGDSPSHSPSPDLLELVPLHPPLLPASNVIRSSITPATYPSIYTKVITQGLTPTIPINLADVTRAMVQGWKADGEWPPKNIAVVEPPVAKRAKRRSLIEGLGGRGMGILEGVGGKGVGKVKRVFGFGNEAGGEG